MATVFEESIRVPPARTGSGVSFVWQPLGSRVVRTVPGCCPGGYGVGFAPRGRGSWKRAQRVQVHEDARVEGDYRLAALRVHGGGLG